MKKTLINQDKYFILQEMVTWSVIEYYKVTMEVNFGTCFESCSYDNACAGFYYELNSGSCKKYHYRSQYFSAGLPGIGDHLVYYLEVKGQASRGELPPNKFFYDLWELMWSTFFLSQSKYYCQLVYSVVMASKLWGKTKPKKFQRFKYFYLVS